MESENTMNKNRKIASAFTLAAILVAVGAAADEPAPPPRVTSTIAVNVGTFRNQEGALGCRLFSSGAGFPETSKGTVERRVAITGNEARCDFENVPPGTYAVSVMHDENDNQKLDKNFLGIPTEGYGVSNNKTHAMSTPTWEECRFVVERGKDVGLAVGLRY